MSRPILVTVTPANVNLAGIAALQTTAGAANLVLTAAAASLTNASNIAFTSTGNISGVNFVITGTDADGNAVSETLAGPNNNTVYSVNYYQSITTIAASGAVATNTKVGWDGTSSVIASKTVALNFYGIMAAALSIEITGTTGFTVQQTFDEIILAGTAKAVWYSVTALATKSANTAAQISVGATGCRLLVNSYSNGAVLNMVINQVGPGAF